MIKVRTLAAALFALGCAGSALGAAPEEQAPASQQATENAAPADAAQAAADDSEVVCRVLKVTGSRLSNQRTCLTRQQWREQRRDQQRETDRAQRQRSYTDGAG